jgi:hypothetical protein
MHAILRTIPRGTRVYITGKHPWSDCAGIVMANEYDTELEKFGIRVHLECEDIDVMVWDHQQLHRLEG